MLPVFWCGKFLALNSTTTFNTLYFYEENKNKKKSNETSPVSLATPIFM